MAQAHFQYGIPAKEWEAVAVGVLPRLLTETAASIHQERDHNVH
jgi:hypothetical protein